MDLAIALFGFALGALGGHAIAAAYGDTFTTAVVVAFGAYALGGLIGYRAGMRSAPHD